MSSAVSYNLRRTLSGCFVALIVCSLILQNTQTVVAAGVPAALLDVPTNLFTGEPLSFSVSFDNTGADTGYGPYIDLFLPKSGTDGTAAGGNNDGITITNANYLGGSVSSSTLDCPTGNTVTHPLTGNLSPAPPRQQAILAQALSSGKSPFFNCHLGVSPPTNPRPILASLLISATLLTLIFHSRFRPRQALSMATTHSPILGVTHRLYSQPQPPVR
ncbi:MAG: hypothetical protein GFH27_549279n510 [Chloroflexi bacterium AL-W]|nr:hypothetical protein [Chloroflexi bacterium AL-N1]NOK65475.1 hypothetical protein [Chloroflexi bacterium AL-N10]NOK72259.1 hypothetical protein [Chloroflexi bacterium AL-N5]NOK79655.1 hypothetical protein [Chloroflexi bacterium AL-W]NOK87570.1 hypothetical protein [Chloroflexi bacterium AL-N15]